MSKGNPPSYVLREKQCGSYWFRLEVCLLVCFSGSVDCLLGLWGLLLFGGVCFSCGSSLIFVIFFWDISVSGPGPGGVPAEAPFSPSGAQLIFLLCGPVTSLSASESSSLISLLTDRDASFFNFKKMLFASDFFFQRNIF